MLVMVVASNMITPELDGISELGRWVFLLFDAKKTQKEVEGVGLAYVGFCLSRNGDFIRIRSHGIHHH